MAGGSSREGQEHLHFGQLFDQRLAEANAQRPQPMRVYGRDWTALRDQVHVEWTSQHEVRQGTGTAGSRSGNRFFDVGDIS